MMSERIRIGELAKRTGCSIDAIRYYERQGLLPQVDRSVGNFRLYDEEAVERLQFIRHCRSLDMNLAEVAALLRAQDHPDENCEDVTELLDGHIAEVARRIADLERLESYLTELRGCCVEGSVARQCGILKGIAKGPEGVFDVESA
jgi:Cd(II)/Pb(II)-responsive transcriptional regulator